MGTDSFRDSLSVQSAIRTHSPLWGTKRYVRGIRIFWSALSVAAAIAFLIVLISCDDSPRLKAEEVMLMRLIPNQLERIGYPEAVVRSVERLMASDSIDFQRLLVHFGNGFLSIDTSFKSEDVPWMRYDTNLVGDFVDWRYAPYSRVENIAIDILAWQSGGVSVNVSPYLSWQYEQAQVFRRAEYMPDYPNMSRGDQLSLQGSQEQIEEGLREMDMASDLADSALCAGGLFGGFHAAYNAGMQILGGYEYIGLALENERQFIELVSKTDTAAPLHQYCDSLLFANMRKRLSCIEKVRAYRDMTYQYKDLRDSWMKEWEQLRKRAEQLGLKRVLE